MKRPAEKKKPNELRMKSDDFDRVMRRALRTSPDLPILNAACRTDTPAT